MSIASLSVGQLEIAPLSQVPPEDTARFGGKACGLARLMRAGARVPGGFAVSVTDRPPERWTPEERARFLDLAGVLLCRGPIAVRSSAAAEDGVVASYAGLFDSVLNVATPEAALEAVARCIASGAGERVRAYAKSGPLPVGVVCQTMVPASAAGVCFTVDPTGQDAGTVLEVVAGLGEALVSGHATPDRWRIYLDGRGRWEAHGDPTPRAPFTRAQAIEVAQGARALAESFGCPLDMEFALDGAGTLHWVQARPVTVAAPPPPLTFDLNLKGADDGPVRVWANYNVCETMPEPLPELSWSIWRDLIPPAVARMAFDVDDDHDFVSMLRVFDRVNGRVYWNLNALIAHPMGSRVADLMDLVDPRSGRVTHRLIREGVLTPRRSRVSPERRVLRVLRRILLHPVHQLAGFFPLRVRARLEAFADSERERRAQPVAPLTDAQLFAEIHRIAGKEVLAISDFLQVFALGLVNWGLAARLFRRWPDAVIAMGSGFAMTPTAEMSLHMDELLQQARPLADRFESHDPAKVKARLAEDEPGRAWLRAYDQFIYRCSQRCPREFDISVPRWDEDPSMLFGILRAGLKNPPAVTLAERQRTLRAERRVLVDRAIAEALPPLRPLMRVLAANVDAYLPLREAPKHALLIVFQRVRHVALEMGRRLVERGVIDVRDDVFHLELEELRRLFAGETLPHTARELVALRRAQNAAWSAMTHPAFVRSDGVPVLDTPPVIPGTLASGVPVSTGRAAGPVRVLDHPDAEAFQDGDVLVVELADPGWTPLFSRASAIVMEVGGVMCHAAVVARELGIPAVVGVIDARKLLKNGQRVIVDGTRGVVLPEEPQAATTSAS